MRWLVEVTSIGKTDGQSFCVEADSWQRALQNTRVMRGETGPMSGFSIELLEEGYRAVDPMARLRYVVKRAADDAPLTAGAPTATTASVPPPAAAGGPPRPGAPGPASKKGNAAPAKTIAFGSPGAAEEKPAANPPKPANAANVAPPASAAQPTAQPAAPPAPVAPAATAAPPVSAAQPAAQAAPSSLPTDLPATQVIFKREQEPMPAAPLTYREYVYAVAQGTSEDTGARLLQAQFELIRGSLKGARPGKLVNLAVFDTVFQGRPPVPPLATLSWKDWKGEPVTSFPRRAPRGGAPVSGVTRSAPPPAPVSAAPVPVAPPPPVPQFPAANAAPVVPPAPNTQPLLTKPASIPPPKPTSLPQQAAPAATAQQEPSQPGFTVGGVSTRPRAASSSSFRAGRLKGDELITSLFEAMHDLHFLRDSLEGGDFCLTLALERLPSQMGIIHFFDIGKREFIVACTRGSADRLLTKRYAENDPVLAAALRKRRAVVWGDASVDGSSRTERFQGIGGARSLIVAPIMQAGRALGAIEIVNPTDNTPFTEEEGNAVTYIAEQFSEFISSRGLILDAEKIARARSAPPPAMR